MKAAYIIGTGLALLAGYACDAGDSLFSEGGVISTGTGGDDVTSGGGSVAQGGDGVTVSVGAGGSPSQGGAGGVGEGGKSSAGGGGAGEGGGAAKLECSLPDWCDEADPDKCVCTGCNNQNPQCTDGEDCVCPDCHNAQVCQGCGMGGPNGICNPYYEGCSCPDCAEHPLCLKD